VPATIGVLNGSVVVGLSASELEELASPQRKAAKLSSRDLGIALAVATDGATTVAGTIAVAHHVGIDVMATGDSVVFIEAPRRALTNPPI